MTCRQCRKKFEDFESRCPHCGTTHEEFAGMYQTSTVLIATSGTDQVYRSVQDVPVGLRTRLLKSTNGTNSATILIADRRGRKEIAKAMRNLPGPAQRRWMQTVLGTEAAAAAMEWLTAGRRRAISGGAGLLILLAAALILLRLG
jgi:hypothetical protein